MQILPTETFRVKAQKGVLVAVLYELRVIVKDCRVVVDSPSLSTNSIAICTLEGNQKLHVLRFRSVVMDIVVAPHFLVVVCFQIV